MSEQQPPLTPDDQPFVPTGEPNPLPAGAAFEADPNIWYHLQVHYKDKKGNPVVGLMYPQGKNPSTSFWDYQVLGGSADGLPPTKIKVHPPDQNGWSHWELNDGNWLSIKATGWIYRSSAYPIGWKLIENNLYNTYWAGEAGSQWRDSFGETSGYYMGMDLPVFTCELIPATD